MSPMINRADWGDRMFGIDPYVFETLWPSLLGIAGMTAVMIWGAFKVRKLINEDVKK